MWLTGIYVFLFEKLIPSIQHGGNVQDLCFAVFEGKSCSIEFCAEFLECCSMDGASQVNRTVAIRANGHGGIFRGYLNSKGV